MADASDDAFVFAAPGLGIEGGSPDGFDAFPPLTFVASEDDDNPLLILPAHDQVVVDGQPNGLVEQVGSDRFATRAIGVASETDVLTRADGDARYAQPGMQGIRTVATAPTIGVTDFTLLVNANAAPITVALPAAAGMANRILTIKKIDASANVVTIDPNDAELVDGAATLAVSTQYQSFTIQCDGAAWWVL